MAKDDTGNTDMLKNVLHSTENALMALSQLEKNLIQGRFKEGAAPYAAMCKTLVGQRIWTSDKHDEKINSNFQKISRVAQNIVNIFTPYVENLNRLTMIDREIVLENDDSFEVLESIDNKVTGTEFLIPEEELIIEAVKKSPKKQLSYTKLRTTLGWDRKKIDSVLEKLIEKTETIAVTMAGSRKIIILKS